MIHSVFNLIAERLTLFTGNVEVAVSGSYDDRQVRNERMFQKGAFEMLLISRAFRSMLVSESP